MVCILQDWFSLWTFKLVVEWIIIVNSNLSSCYRLTKLTQKLINVQTRSGIRFATPNALAFWQWLALCKVRSSEARCVSPAYIIAVRNWRVRSTKSERKQRTMRHYQILLLSYHTVMLRMLTFQTRSSIRFAPPNSLAFWQWLTLSKLQSNKAKCASPAYIIAIHDWQVLARSQSGNGELYGFISFCWYLKFMQITTEYQIKGSHYHLPPLVADVFVFADLSIKQPELIMPKRAH